MVISSDIFAVAIFLEFYWKFDNKRFSCPICVLVSPDKYLAKTIAL